MREWRYVGNKAWRCACSVKNNAGTVNQHLHNFAIELNPGYIEIAERRLSAIQMKLVVLGGIN